MSQDCLFCRIARGEIACHAVYEDDAILAFLDIHPIRPAHTLIIPRQHYPWFEELPTALATDITTLAQRLAREMKAIYPVERVAMFYAGLHVNHATRMWSRSTMPTTSPPRAICRTASTASRCRPRHRRKSWPGLPVS